jgi:hypothetical protein
LPSGIAGLDGNSPGYPFNGGGNGKGGKDGKRGHLGRPGRRGKGGKEGVVLRDYLAEPG